MVDVPFAEFYRQVHAEDGFEADPRRGRKPFRWQERLAGRVLQGGWPPAIAIPTGLGKTCVLDIAVFAMAAASQGRQPTRRIIYVIDRRVVVDDVYEHASNLAKKLKKGGTPELQAVQRALLSLGGDEPLKVTELRGGVYRDESWVRDPCQPQIIVSTIDQVGSRLLFRGYGISPSQRPIHAGLLGIDALWILDEAHLAEPFRQTLERVKRIQEEAEVNFARAPVVVAMSATLKEQGEEKEGVFGLEGPQETEVENRLDAEKPARLVKAGEDFAGTCLAELRRILELPEARAVAVVVNRVGSAREIFERLREEPGVEAHLLTGRIRPIDRERWLPGVAERLRSGAERGDSRLVIVATQTIEVGADLDFDAMVTEAAPLSALRQRFGRVRRLGRGPVLLSAVVLREGKSPDPVYGESLEKTWKWLWDRARRRRGDRLVDFGIRAMEALLRDGKPEEAPALDLPLLRPHVEALEMTRPGPEVDVSRWLHGLAQPATPDVLIVWREDLSVADAGTWVERVVAMPPDVGEALPVPIWAFRAWLGGEKAAGEVADLEGAAEPDPNRSHEARRPVLVWRGPDEVAVVDPEKVRVGDTVVVPSTYGGADEYGWNPSSVQRVRDEAERASIKRALEARTVARVRLVPEVADLLARPGEERVLRPLLEALGRAVQAGDDDAASGLLQQVAGLMADDLAPAAEAMTAGNGRLLPYPGGAVWVAPVGASSRAEPEMEEDEALSMTGDPIPLHVHSGRVRDRARRYAAQLGLPAGLQDDLAFSGERHDVGKVDPRFQAMLHGGDKLAALASGEPLAKSGIPPWDREARRRARELSELPDGFRHEFVSVRLAEQILASGGGPPVHDADLTLHLIGAHHGWGRPHVPWHDDPRPQRAVYQWDGRTAEASSVHMLWRADSGWPERFALLSARYGPWGLAFLEALLRLADWAESAG